MRIFGESKEQAATEEASEGSFELEESFSGSCWTGWEDILKHCIFPGRFRVFEAERELTRKGASSGTFAEPHFACH